MSKKGDGFFAGLLVICIIIGLIGQLLSSPEFWILAAPIIIWWVVKKIKPYVDLELQKDNKPITTKLKSDYGGLILDGKCVVCGKPIGFFHKSHKECKEAFQTGRNQMILMVEKSISDKTPPEVLEPQLREVAKSHFIDESELRKILITGWGNVVEKHFEEGILTDEEESYLTQMANYFSLTKQDLDINGAWTRLVKGAVLRDMTNGKIPERVKITDGNLPFNFLKDEKLIWLFKNVRYYEQKTKREYVGGYQGVSIRVARGLYYRVGGFRGRPIETTETVNADTGLLAITNQHLYFSGGSKSFRIHHDKIVSINPYSDGVGIQQDRSNAKPQSFVTGDGWFTYNVLMNVAHL